MNIIRPFLKYAFVIVALILSICIVTKNSLAQQSDQDFWDTTILQLMEKHHVPGSVVIMIKDGQVVLQKGYGTKDVEKKTPITIQEDVFRIASVSKVMTHLGVMQLVDKGKIRLDDDINSYLGETKIVTKFSEPIRIKNLLTHTDGFEDEILGVVAKDSSSILTIKEYLQKYKPQQILAPGTEITYGNYATMLSGLIIENVSGMRFEDYISQNIFKPLGMENSSFKEPINNATLIKLIQEYQVDNDTGELKKIEILYPQVIPAGAAYSTANDMTHFLQMLLHKGAPILSESAFSEFAKQQYTSHPKLPGITYGFFEHYENGKRGLVRDGDGIGFKSKLFILPEEKTGFFVYGNNDNDEFRVDILHDFLDHYYPSDSTQELTPTISSIARLNTLTGTYAPIQQNRSSFTKMQILFAGYVKISTDENGYLITEPLALGEAYGGFSAKQKWVEVEPLLFKSSDGERMIAFIQDGNTIRLASGSGYHGVYTKAPFYATTPFNIILAGFSSIVFLFVIIISLIRFIKFIILFGRKQKTSPLTIKLIKFVPFVVVVVDVLFILSAMVAMFVGNSLISGLPNYVFGVPSTLSVILQIPYLIVLLSLLVGGLTIWMWREKPEMKFERYYYLFLVFAQTVSVWQIYYWNLIGIH